MATPYMSLSLPEPSVTAGPAWASDLNAALEVIDGHDHTPGSGVAIRSSALSIDGDVNWNGYNATGLRSVRLADQGSAIAAAPDIGCLFLAGGDLFYNNGIGQHIQITSGAGLNAASIGGIGGDYVGSGSSVFYTSATQAFSFWQAANQYANLWTGSLKIFRSGETSPNGITVQPPTSLAAAYSITLPAALPGSTLPLLMSTAGVVSLGQLATAQIADAAVTAAKTDAVSTATASRLMVRDSSGRVAVATPSASGDASTKGYTDSSDLTSIASAVSQASVHDLVDLSRAQSGCATSGDWFAMDTRGTNWIGASSSVNKLYYNGTELTMTSATRFGDAAFHYSANLFVFCNNGSGGQCTVPVTGGAATSRSGNGSLTLAYNHSLGLMISTSDGTSSNVVYTSSTATTWPSQTLSQTGAWQGSCSLESSGFLVVGNNGSNNVIGCVSADGTTWSNITLPSNTGGTVTSPRTSTGAKARGVVCGVAGTKVFVLTASYIWTATLGADLTVSGNWTRAASPAAFGGAVPSKARSAVGVALVSFDATDLVGVSADGSTWRYTYPTGNMGANPGVVLGIGYSYLTGRRQLGAMVGASAGASAVVMSGIQGG